MVFKTEALVFLVIMFAYSGVPLMVNGAVYTVGGFTGWTTIGHYDYAKWAANQTFQVGDAIRFVFNPAHHNVMEVSSSDYESCNAEAATSIYITGDDTIPLTKEGHHYFICGVPGHCQVGQKVDIQVSTKGGAMTPTMSPANSTSPSNTTSSASKYSSKDLIVLVPALVVSAFGFA
ncbi:mavicyanin-like [Papaver somniferum]|uniref:mavicyanin-like n=1 Tax=Papaver somniferum TaxID=3469 RepID=UPI000E6F9C81|nr:mavicyanin-like [Papaver somniferum]